MVVRVKVKIKAVESEKSVSTVAVANAGFETDSPELIMPLRLALELGFSIEKAREEAYMTVGGPTTMYRVPDPLEIQAIAKDRETKPLKCSTTISKAEDEVVLSDRLISKLRIALEDVGEGLWRFRDESPTELRKSEEPERW